MPSCTGALLILVNAKSAHAYSCSGVNDYMRYCHQDPGTFSFYVVAPLFSLSYQKMLFFFSP